MKRLFFAPINHINRKVTRTLIIEDILPSRKKYDLTLVRKNNLDSELLLIPNEKFFSFKKCIQCLKYANKYNNWIQWCRVPNKNRGGQLFCLI